MRSTNSIVIDVYGDLTLDHVGELVRLGGPGYYVSRAVACLSARTARVRIHSHLTKDAIHSIAKLLEEFNAEIVPVEAQAMTVFKHEYKRRGTRTLSIISRSRTSSSPGLLDNYAGNAAIVSPVAYEVSYNLVSKLRFSYSLVGVDLQGFVRVGEPGAMVDTEPYLAKFVEFGVGPSNLLVKASHEEVSLPSIDALLQRVETLLITMGHRGALLFSQDAAYYVPPLFVSSREPVGAGDMFLASMVISMILESSDVLAAAVHASAAVPMLLEGFCPDLDTVAKEARRVNVKRVSYAEALYLIKYAQQNL